MFTFAHLSDPHLTTLDRISWTALLNKRIMGYISWKTHRRAEHRREVLDLLLGSLHQHSLDHIVITGDLTHLGLPQEFQEARLWLDSLGKIAETTVIPGNHEAYVSTSYESTLKQWEPYFQSDAPKESHRPGKARSHFPSLRIRGPVAFIGLSTACPTAPFLATGSLDVQQLEDLTGILRSLQSQTVFKVLLIHHPPLSHTVRWRKRLTNTDQLHEVLSRFPVDLILHGHSHKCALEFLSTRENRTPIIGVPSASAKGEKSGDESQYCLFHLKRQADAFQLSASLYSYVREKAQFMFSRTLPLP
ncbi:MAG: metallophosphoesterase [Nitrospirales bacterium]|nr:metallophosphoesterase [Nitrospirales bacterium]